MPKAKPVKRHGRAASSRTPYDRPSAAPRAPPSRAPPSRAPPAPPKENIFRFNKDLGQHVLRNGDVCIRIVDAAAIQPHDTVLEVGPGTGALTGLLLDRARHVTAVELDPRMAAELTRRVQGTPRQRRLRVLLGDFVRLAADEIPAHDVCVSNTPYQISSPLVFKLLSLPKPPRTAILMFQREFAQRLLARPGDSMYSRLSVNAQFFATISHVMKVGRKNFTPPPQVDSSVVRLEPRTNRPPISFDEFDGLLRVCFMRKNRTMRASWTMTQVRAMMGRNWLTWASLYPDRIAAADRVFLGNREDGGADGADGAAAGGPDDADAADPDGGTNDDADDDEKEDEEDDDEAGEAMYVDEESVDRVEKWPVKGGDLTLDGIRVSRARVEALVRRKVEAVLEDTGLGPQRAAKCDEHDFLRLLLAFNKEGLHFS